MTNTNQIGSKSSANSELAKLVGELMARYDAFRGMWIEQFGNADGFDAWFTCKALSTSSKGGSNG
jgi:hypothetical protein